MGIDHQLVIDADEEIFEMNNGCICCTVRGDLIRIISDLMARRDRFDHLGGGLRESIMPSNYPGFRYGADRETFSAAKVKALESLLIEKGIITGDIVVQILGYFETEMGPFN